MNETPFQQAKLAHLKTLSQYIPIVDRVHGFAHPEFHDVRSVFDIILAKANEAKDAKPQLDEEFTKLRDITNNYTMPNDVCESYEAVYHMLQKLDAAYYASS